MIFTGTGVALVTPFDENLHIDRESLIRLVEHVTNGGVNYLVVLGTTAETATMTLEERKEVVSIVAEANNGKLPLVVGIGGNDTQDILDEMKDPFWAEKCQAILSITPYYNKPNQEGLYRHFKALAEASPLPVCLYNVPGRTGVNMNATTVMRLMQDFPNIAAIKEASCNFEQAIDLLKMKNPAFKALSGDDATTLPLMSMGFDGVISVISNIFPKEFSSMVNSADRGDFVTARAINLQLADMYKALFEEGNPTGVKAALHAAGIIRHNVLRLPLVPASDRLYARIQKLLG